MKGIIITIFIFGMLNFTLANDFSLTEEEEKDYTKIRDGKTLRKLLVYFYAINFLHSVHKSSF